MKFISALILVLISIIIAGCGPIYNTQYTYIPPRSSAGIMCINTCEVNKLNCQRMQELRRENCEYRAELDYRWCIEHSAPGSSDRCFKRSCSLDSFGCTSEYNRCYQSCGGVIEQQDVCVAFCR